MTKYVLNSGGAKRYFEKTKKYIAEIVKGLGDSPRVLYCFFARPREDWENSYVRHVNGFKESMPEKLSPSLKLAFPDKFVEQISKSDVVFIPGGDDHLLKYWFKQFDIPEVWKNKTIATSSASSDVLAKQYWTCDWRACMDGFGIIPIKFIPHYESDFGADDSVRGPIDWQKAYKELEEYGDQDLPIHALKEGEYIVVEK